MFICACSDVGRVRDVNQDATYYVEDEMLPIYLVADGMGGHKSGDYASNLAIHTVAKMYDLEREGMISGTVEIPDFVNRAFKVANSEILKESQADDIKKMGTTLTMALIFGGEVYIGHIGDSRAYLVRDGEMVQLTHDHSLVAELLRTGSITPEEAYNHPQKNVITKALGTDSEINPDIYTEQVRKDDIMILCSDGLTNMMRDEEILERVKNSDEKEMLCETLTNEANQRGGPDNISVLIIKA